MLPANAAENLEEQGSLFVLSSAFVFYFIAYGVKVSGSFLSVQSLVGVIWLLRFFLPNMFVQDTYHPVLLMVGMTDPVQFQLATVVANAATIVTLGASSMFGAVAKLELIKSDVPWSKFYRFSLVTFGIGLISISLFVIVNVGSLGAAIVDGAMRSTEVIGGTGYLRYLSLALIPGALLFSYCHYQRWRRFSIVAWVPAIVAFFALSLLGGRVRALIPLAAVAFLFMRAKNLDRPSMRSAAILFSGVVTVLIYMAIGMTYRAGGIETVLQLGVEEIVDYVTWTIPGEIGQLHGPYLAIAYGEGRLGGETYRVLLWPLSEIFGWESRHSGVFVRDLGIGEGAYEKNWGFHPSLIGDAIINYGRWFVPFKFAIFGALIGWLQSSKRQGVFAIPLSILVTLGLARAFSESTDKIVEVYIYVVMAYATLFMARLTIRGRARDKATCVGSELPANE